MRGKFIAYYGINNLGKTYQAQRMVEWLNTHDIWAEYRKDPAYNLDPFGPIINNYLRGGNPYGLTSRQIQTCYMLNRDQLEPIWEVKLGDGTWVIAEDYTGTGIAWGVAGGVSKDYLISINKHLVKPDLSILFEGERFTNAVEEGHLHEEDDGLTERSAKAHRELAVSEGWVSVNANQTRDQVFAELLAIIKYSFDLG